MRVEQPSERLLEYFTRVFVFCQVVRAIFCGGKLPAKVQSFICPSGTSRTPSPTVGQSTSHVFCICSGKFPAESGTPALLGVCGLAAHNKMFCRARCPHRAGKKRKYRAANLQTVCRGRCSHRPVDFCLITYYKFYTIYPVPK